jgi:hypothetical protein
MRDQDSDTAAPQFSSATVAKEPELPKLIARVRRLGPAVAACSGRRIGSVAEAGGGTARHTRLVGWLTRHRG